MSHDPHIRVADAVLLTLADRNQMLTSFYTQLFNQNPSVHIPGVYAEFQLPGLRLGIFEPKVSNQAEFATVNGLSGSVTSGGMSLCLEVQSLEAAITHLTDLGAPLGEIMQASHGREVYAYDPLGNRLILHEGNSSR